MDHLPIPKNRIANERAIVPYVCLKDYDGEPFLTYPIREGVTHALPPDGNIPGGSPYRQHEQTYPSPKQEQEDFLQRWLFFGLSHEILGNRWRPEVLLRTIEAENDAMRVVSTSGLVEALDEWIADIHAGSSKPRHTYEHIAECLRLTFATLHGAGPDFDLQIKISIASLGELFAFAANQAYDARTNKCPGTFSRLLDYDNWKRTMLLSGWCPSQVNVIFDECRFIQTLHFLTNFGQPASDGFHRNCDNDRCLAYQNDLTTYRTKHVTGCTCDHLSIHTERLIEILESGSLPLLRIEKGDTLSELSVELVPSQPTSRYIALSHVWADGLGNPFENALPRCQLEFLRRTVEEKYTEINSDAAEAVLLWCDTLCCPVQPGKAKNIALTQMKKTYQEATRVLVLDASLHTCDAKTMDTHEACIRVANSGWTRRLWTLQEGALPARNRRLDFLFRDQAINLQFFIQEISQTSKTSIGRRGLTTSVFSLITNFANVYYTVDGKQHGDLGSVETGLQHRSVSVLSDEPLLIANLLDLDVAEILNGQCPLTDCKNIGCAHSRIHRLWLLMPTAFQGLPRSVLLRVGPRLSEPGFRWAPSTLLHIERENRMLQSRKRSENEDTFTATTGSMYRPSNMMISTLLDSLPMLVSTFWKIVADFLCYIQASLETIGWAQNFRSASLATESADRGIPTKRGLLVRFTGYSLTMADCPPGIPSNLCNVTKQEGLLYVRGVDGKWYFIDRRLPAKRDPFLSTKSVRAVLQEEQGKFWLTHEESAFNDPNLVAKANGGQQVANAILVQLLSDEEGIKYVQSKLHINIARAKDSVRIMFEAAYQSAKQVSRDQVAIRSAAKSDDEPKGGNDVTSTQSQSTQASLEREIHRVAIKNASADVVAAAAAFSKDGLALYKGLIAMMVMGDDGNLSVRTREKQLWCFD